MFPVDKTFMNDVFQTEESINRGVPMAKPKLERRKQSMGFKIPHEPIIHHARGLASDSQSIGTRFDPSENGFYLTSLDH